MSPVIKLPGGKAGTTKAKPEPRRAPAKDKSKPKQGRAKPKQAPAQSSNGGERRVAKDGRVLRVPKDLDPKVLERFESQLGEAGERVKAAKAEHDAAIDAVHGVVVQAQQAEIPMAIIEDITGISRQWLYKMGTMIKRGGGNGKAKPANGRRKAASSTPTKAAPKRNSGSTAKRAASAANRTAKRSGPSIKLSA